MVLEPEKIHYDFDRKTYWTRIYAKSNGRESVILVCASRNFLQDYFKLRESISDEKLKEWFVEVLKKWEVKGEKIFEQKVHYDVYSMTAEGLKNGIEFLKNEIVP